MKMINIVRNVVDRNLSENLTANLLELRKVVLQSKGIKRSIALRKYLRIQRSFVADIPIETEIGEGLTLPHGASGIFISRGAKIGSNCVIFQQVTIGSNTLPESKTYGAPMIGNNVYIGAGAKIIGKVSVGDNCRIGANAIVVEDVAPNCTVVMNKPRIILKDNNKNEFISYEEELNAKK